MMAKMECCLCSQIEGREESDLIARLLPGVPYARRIMLESASFAVVPDLAPLVPGHALLCPRTHARSFAQIEDHLHAEFEQIKATLKAALRERYGADVTLFEHGMAAAGDRTLCTVDHAHVHVLPLPFTRHAHVPHLDAWTVFDGSLSALRQLSRGREYIFYETPDGICRVFVPLDQPMESQYMRRVIAEASGRAEPWNWREAPDPRAAHETWRQFVAPLEHA